MKMRNRVRQLVLLNVTWVVLVLQVFSIGRPSGGYLVRGGTAGVLQYSLGSDSMTIRLLTPEANDSLSVELVGSMEDKQEWNLIRSKNHEQGGELVSFKVRRPSGEGNWLYQAIVYEGDKYRGVSNIVRIPGQRERDATIVIRVPRKEALLLALKAPIGWRDSSKVASGAHKRQLRELKVMLNSRFIEHLSRSDARIKGHTSYLLALTNDESGGVVDFKQVANRLSILRKLLLRYLQLFNRRERWVVPALNSYGQEETRVLEVNFAGPSVKEIFAHESIGGPAWVPDLGSPTDITLAAVSDLVDNDSTLILTGAGLDAASDFFYGIGDKMLPLVKSLHKEEHSVALRTPGDHGGHVALVYAKDLGTRGLSEPLRVNAPEVQSLFPQAISELAEIRSTDQLHLVGKSLSVPGAAPKAVLQSEQGDFQWLEVSTIEDNPYRAMVAVKGDISPGRYRLWYHNGTGASFGWSPAVELRVVDEDPLVSSATDLTPCSDAGTQINALLASGETTITLNAGVYIIDEPIVVNRDEVTIIGAGRAEKSTITEEVVTDISKADYDPAATILKVAEGAPLDTMIKVLGDGFTLKKLTMIAGNPGNETNIESDGNSLHNCITTKLKSDDYGRHRGTLIEDASFIVVDVRPAENDAGLNDDGFNSGAVSLQSDGAENTVIRDCAFYTPSHGVRVGLPQPSRKYDLPVDEPTTHVMIQNNEFFGTYAGEKDGKARGHSGGRAAGVVFFNGRNLLVEGNTFRNFSTGESPRFGMNRSLLSFNTANRHVYAAGNDSWGTGSRTSAGMHPNQGEQYLFHFRKPSNTLHTVASNESPTTVTLVSGSVAPSGGGEVPLVDPLDLVAYEDNWLRVDLLEYRNWGVLVLSGGGKGQFRFITGKQENEDGSVDLTVEKPFNVLPQEGDEVLVYSPQMGHIFFNNTFELASEDALDLRCMKGCPKHLKKKGEKAQFIFLYHGAYGNVIDGNKGSHSPTGIAISSTHRMPSYWNTVRNNSLSYISGGHHYDSSVFQQTALTLYHKVQKNHVFADGEIPRWSFGNAYRLNEVSNSTYGAQFVIRYTGYDDGFVPLNSPGEIPPDAPKSFNVFESNEMESSNPGQFQADPFLGVPLVRGNVLVDDVENFSIATQGGGEPLSPVLGGKR